ncbi:UNVERIFIED_CONTAM: hypothetical protein RMT77_002989 [Armadillidium vulgare]
MSDWISKWVVVTENGKNVTKRFRCILGWMHILERNGMVYVSGYIAKKMMNKHRDCDVCQFGTEEKCCDGDDKIFLLLKNFSDDHSKGLIQPTEEFFKYIIECEAMFERILNNNYIRGNVGYLLQENIASVTSFPFCSHKIKIMFLSLFVRMRINFILKFKNKSLKRDVKNKRTTRKLKKIFHL